MVITLLAMLFTQAKLNCYFLATLPFSFHYLLQTPKICAKIKEVVSFTKAVHSVLYAGLELVYV